MPKSRMMSVVIALQLLILAGQWLGGGSYLSSANAQLADPGRDRAQLLDEMRAINAKLDRLTEILSSGSLQVRVVQSDEANSKPPAR